MKLKPKKKKNGCVTGTKVTDGQRYRYADADTFAVEYASNRIYGLHI